MTAPPDAAALARAIARWIEGLPLAAPHDYERKVVAGLLGILEREYTLGPAADAIETAGLAALLGPGATLDDLVAAIRSGRLDPTDRQLLAHLIRTTRDRIAIDQPRYAHGLNAAPSPPARALHLVEVSPRDGLQNEARVLTVADRVELIARAVGTGARRIEVASFVDPRRVPQMAEAEAVIAALPDTGAQYIGLVLNRRGAERALATAVHQLGVVVAASDAFGQRNQGQTVAEGLAMAGEVFALARAAGRSAQATIAVAFGCPFAGAVEPGGVIALARALADAGAEEVALADTIGVARPDQVAALFRQVNAALGGVPLRAHFHDTRGTGVANALAAAAAGATALDAALGGTGGCPFAPGAAGNVATEDVAFAFGDRLVIDLSQAIANARWLGERLGKPPVSALANAPDWKENRDADA